MKRKIKECKGLNESICMICARQNDKEEKSLVSFISINHETDKEFCNYFLKK